MANPSSQLDVIVQGKDNLSPDLAKLESKVIRFVGAISAALAGIKIGAAPIIAASNFERELANVAKTTDFTVAQINQLSTALLKISTQVDVSAVDLAKIAAAAGQQGLGRQGVAGVVQFTDSVARMSSVLDVTAEEAATNVGKILNVFKLPLADVEKAVSTFNEVSNNSTANGKELLDVVKRIGDAAGILNLQQSTALAATGLDFGLSPEVTGSAITRVFQSAFQNADKFGELMKINATDWIQTLKTDAVGGFKQFLDALRKLDAQSQQTAITKLVGGGRYGALLNKLIQDSSNAVLDRNLESANKGALGTSALKEQAKVLDTLDAQAKILGNTLTKLGIESAQQLLQPLKQYAAQLTEALQTPGVKSFVNAAVQALGQLIGFIASTVKAVAGLNVNWENFIKVLEVFIGLKIASAIGGLLSQFKLFGFALKSISTDASAATAATKGLAAAGTSLGGAGDAAAFKASTRARLLGYEELSIASQKAKANSLAEKAAKEALEKAALAAQAAQAKAVPLQQAAKKTETAANVAGTRTSIAKSEVLFQDSAIIASRNKTNNALLESQQKFEDKQIKQKYFTASQLLKIETDYQSRVAALLASSKAAESAEKAAQARLDAARAAPTTGAKGGPGALLQADKATQVARAEAEVAYQAQRRALIQAGVDAELVAVDAGRKAAIAAQEKYESIAIANMRAFYSKRLATIEASGAAELTAEKAILAQKIANLDALTIAQTAANAKAAAASATAVAAQGTALAANATAAAAQLATAAGASAGATVGIFARASAFITASLGNIAIGIRALIGVLGTLARVASSAFLWVTIIYTLLDLTGVLDKLGPLFTRITDAIGLSSKAQRDAKIAADATSQAYRDQQVALDALRVSYDKNISAGTGQVDTTKIQALLQQVVQGSPEVQKTALAELSNFFAGANALATTSVELTTKIQKQGMDDQIKIIKDGTAEIARLKQLNTTDNATVAANPEAGGQFADYSKSIAEVQARIDAATAKLDGFNKGLAASGINAAQAGQNASIAFAQIAGLFTPENVAAIEKYIIPLVDAKKEVLRQQEELKKVVPAATAAGVGVEEGMKTAVASLEVANAKVVELQKSFGTFLNLNLGNNTSLAVLPLLAEQSSEALKGLVTEAKKVPQALTGTKVVPTAPKTSGDQKYTGKGTESAARKLARAELEFRRAQIQAANHLTDEQYKQELSAADDFYKKGLTALGTYYDRRKQIQLEAVDKDIADKKLEIQAVDFERKGVAGDPAAAKQFDTKKVQLQGQIAVLQEQKKEIIKQTGRDIRDATKEFNDTVLSETNKLFDEGILQADTGTVFKSNLDALASQYEDTLNRMRVNGQGKLADSLLAGFNVQAFEKAIRPALDAVDQGFSGLNRIQARIALARNDGSITAAEADQRATAAIQEQLPLLETQLGYMQEQLRVLGETAGVGSAAYEKQAAAIDEVILKLQTLSQEANKTARDMNKNLETSLGDALSNLQPTFKSLKETTLNFLLDITNQMKKTFAQDLAQQIMKGLGNVGDQGFGAFFANLLKNGLSGLGGSAASAGAGAGIDAAGKGFSAAKDTGLVTTTADLAGSASEAASTTAASTALASLAAPAGEVALAMSAMAAPTGEVALAMAALPAPVAETVIATQALVTPMGELFLAVSAMVQPAIAAAAALAAVAASSSTQAATGAISAVAAAHTGGRVGFNLPPSTRKVNPAVFNNAVRYHTGGIAGLRPNEVPTILEKGEHVLTARQAAQQKAAGGKGGAINIRSVLAVDPQFVPDGMASSQGERTLMTLLSKNKATLKQLVN